MGSRGLYIQSQWVAWVVQNRLPGPKTKTTCKLNSNNMATVDYFQRKLDDKRRLTIPAELRAEFASGVVITRGFQKYLHLYPKLVWEQDR